MAEAQFYCKGVSYTLRVCVCVHVYVLQHRPAKPYKLGCHLLQNLVITITKETQHLLNFLSAVVNFIKDAHTSVSTALRQHSYPSSPVDQTCRKIINKYRLNYNKAYNFICVFFLFVICNKNLLIKFYVYGSVHR